HVVAGCCRTLISWSLRQTLAQRIKLAGLSDGWEPEHIVALQGLCGLGMTLIGFLLSASFGLDAFAATLIGVVCGLLGAWLPWQRLMEQGRQRQQTMLR